MTTEQYKIQSGISAVHVLFIWNNQFQIYSFQIYNTRFQIKVGLGATGVTKYLELGKLTSFLWRISDAAPKLVAFRDFHK